MVDLHECNRPDATHKNRDGKVKILMDRTPSFLKSKFLSVLGSSNDLISGLTTKVCMIQSWFIIFNCSVLEKKMYFIFQLEVAVNLSSSSGTNSNDHDTNRNSSTNRTDDGENGFLLWFSIIFSIVLWYSFDCSLIGRKYDWFWIAQSERAKSTRWSVHRQISSSQLRDKYDFFKMILIKTEILIRLMSLCSVGIRRLQYDRYKSRFFAKCEQQQFDAIKIANLVDNSHRWWWKRIDKLHSQHRESIGSQWFECGNEMWWQFDCASNWIRTECFAQRKWFTHTKHKPAVGRRIGTVLPFRIKLFGTIVGFHYQFGQSQRRWSIGVYAAFCYDFIWR